MGELGQVMTRQTGLKWGYSTVYTGDRGYFFLNICNWQKLGVFNLEGLNKGSGFKGFKAFTLSPLDSMQSYRRIHKDSLDFLTNGFSLLTTSIGNTSILKKKSKVGVAPGGCGT